MSTEHPITPPEHLVEEWGRTVLIDYSDRHWGYEQILCAMAARWGADQELEAVEQEIMTPGKYFANSANSEHFRAQLRAARRPTPPSLKEQALTLLEYKEYGSTKTGIEFRLMGKDADIIRRALEALPND